MTVGALRWPRGLPGVIVDGFAGVADDSLNGRTTEVGGALWAVTDGGAFVTDGTGRAYRFAGDGPLGEGTVAHLDAGFADAAATVWTDDITADGHRMGLVFPYVDDNNYWSWFAYRASGGARHYFLRSYVAGVSDPVVEYVSAVGAAAGPVDLEVRCVGTAIDCYYNGVLRHSTVSGTHLGATGFGLQSDIGSGYDDFTVTATP